MSGYVTTSSEHKTKQEAKQRASAFVEETLAPEEWGSCHLAHYTTQDGSTYTIEVIRDFGGFIHWSQY